MKTLTLVLLLCSLLVACKHSEPLAEQSEKPEQQVSSSPQRPFLADQKMCDEQAAKRFHEYTERDETLATYTSHYDPSLKICYVRVNHVTTVNKAPLTSSTIFDAFEGRVYADYRWYNPQGKQFYEVAPSSCEIDLPGKPQITCKSAEEFKNLAEQYFSIAE
jgi:hypothetical protein